MRFVTKPDSDKPDSLKDSPSLKQKLLEIVRSKDTKLISDKIYRDPYITSDGRRSRVEDALAKSYHFKCAFCESLADSDIEHYRPKADVKEVPLHQGYYWLCYEWTNLMPACVKCNRDGGKHSQFPVLGTRVDKPVMINIGNLNFEASKASNSPLIDEKPILLNPEIDDPVKFLSFEPSNDLKGVRLKSISSDVDITKRVEGTIKICKLNRQELCIARLRIIQEFLKSIEYCLEIYDEERAVNRSLDVFSSFELSGKNPEFEHTLLRSYMLESKKNFADLVIPFSKLKFRTLLLIAFDTWKGV